jgi:molecular chaperone DnaK (HSP70)
MEDKNSQSLNVSKSQLSDVQIGQAGKNLSQSQQIKQGGSEKQLSSTEVIEFVTQIETLLRSSDLPEEQKQKALKHLDSVKEEVNGEEPDKDFAAKSLQRATKVLKDASETVDAGNGL